MLDAFLSTRYDNTLELNLLIERLLKPQLIYLPALLAFLLFSLYGCGLSKLRITQFYRIKHSKPFFREY